MRPVHAIRLCVGLLAAGTVLTGCASLPHSSSVQRGVGVGVVQYGNQVSYSPPGPRPGASRLGIVAGYVEAMLASPPWPGRVREFLTPAAAAQWKSDGTVTVYQDHTLTDVGPAAVRLGADVVGSLDARGSWHSADAAHSALDVTLRLVRVHGQWRIDNPQPGILVRADTFTSNYRQYSMYFYGPTHTLLTPDPVFELDGEPSQTATALVQDLLLGPTAATESVVSSEVPATTKLAPAVTVSDGLAVVPLTGQVRALSNSGRLLFAAQLIWTLRSSNLGITAVRITVGGRPVLVPHQPANIPITAFSGYGPTLKNPNDTLYGLSGGLVVSVSATGAFVVQGPLGLHPRNAESLAVDLPSATPLVAVVTAPDGNLQVGSISANQSAHPAPWCIGASALLRPSWDFRGLLWLVAKSDGHAAVLVATGPKASQCVQVRAPGVTGQDVTSFAISPDGMRFAAIIGDGTSSRLVIAMVSRSLAARNDVWLTDTKTITSVTLARASLSSLSWSSPTTISLLASQQDSGRQPYQVAIDGSRAYPIGGVLSVRPRSLAAGPAHEPPVVATPTGELWIEAPNQPWKQLPSKLPVTAPAYPG